jgi:hypothetical protein
MPICQLKINETALTSTAKLCIYVETRGGEKNFMVEKVFSSLFFLFGGV